MSTCSSTPVLRTLGPAISTFPNCGGVVPFGQLRITTGTLGQAYPGGCRPETVLLIWALGLFGPISDGRGSRKQVTKIGVRRKSTIGRTWSALPRLAALVLWRS